MREFNKRRYLLAFIVTAAIFLLGFFFGFVMDVNRINYFQQLNEEQKLNLRSLQLQYEIVKTGSVNNPCGAFRFMFNTFIVELENNRERLETYTLQAKIKKDEFSILQREYVLSQINFWYISKNLKESCPGESDFVTVIYFYSDKTACPSCDDQAAVLNYYKTKLKENLLIFALDERFESTEPIITLLKQSYNVTSYPTLIVNGNEIYTSVLNKETMGRVLCSKYLSQERKAIVCS